MRKKTLSLALALALCLGLLAVPASAASATLTEIVSVETMTQLTRPFTTEIWGFNEGITWTDGGGAFDTNGNVIMEAGYSQAKPFSDGVAWAERGQVWYVVDKTGHELFALNPNGETYTINSLNDFSEGLARVYSRDAGKYGYVDKTGKVAIPFEHTIKAGDFHDGLAVVYDAANAYYGYMDKTGKVVIPCQYTNAKDFAHGVAAVQVAGGRWTIIDRTGKELIPQGYSYANKQWPNDITSQVVMATDSSNKISFINRSGKIVSGGYSSAGIFSDGLAAVGSANGNGFVNESGVLVIPCQYYAVENFRDGYAVICPKYNDPLSIINKTGKVTASGLTNMFDGYNHSYNSGNGCFKIRSNATGMWRYGFIDSTGREIVPCKYAQVNDFSGGVAVVKDFAGKLGFVDTNGTEIAPCKYEEVKETGEPGIFMVRPGTHRLEWCVLKSSGWTVPASAIFTDVPQWCDGAVGWAVSQKITDGVGSSRFAPGNQCTNAMILTFLWRAAGEPGSTAALPVDITGKNLSYAETALRWAAEKGMIDKTLDPTANCTRASAVTYIWQAFGREAASASSFNDVSANAAYAAAVNWAVANGIVEGYPDGGFHPDTICNRGVIVTMLHRAYEPSVRL